MKFEALIIDDDPIFVMIANRMIVNSGFHSSPISFSNGEMALQHLQLRQNPEAIYAIFLDINMPVMNGWEFLDEIHVNAMVGNFYVFLITSSCCYSDRAKASKYPMVMEYIEKPITLQDIKKFSQLAPFKI